MKNILRSAFVAASIALLCACGAKGPLFMPEEAPPVELIQADGEAGPTAPAEDAIDADVEPEPEETPTSDGVG